MRYFTEEEARGYLPRLRQILTVLRKVAEVSARAGTNGHGRAAGSEEETVEIDPELDPEKALAELTDEGIVLRDPRRGLVDFPSRHRSGKVIQLCWQLGEDDLGWWHLPEEGFAGRRPLPVPPDL